LAMVQGKERRTGNRASRRSKRPYVMALLPGCAFGILAKEVHWKMKPVLQLKEAEAKLSDIWQAAMSEIDSASHPADVKKRWREQQAVAQRAWEVFRDADAKVLEFVWWGGSGMGPATCDLACRLTRQRIDELKTRYGIGNHRKP